MLQRTPKVMVIILSLSVALTCDVVFAQGLQTSTSSSSKTTTTRTERKATLNFEDELVEGSTQKPELFYLFQKKNFNYKRLIKLRENFLPEMRRTTEDIQRVRGAN
jgi:hypothetical protein